MIKLMMGDCLDVMRGMESDSVDAVVTDPPSGIHFMGREWDGARGGRDQWIAWLAERMREAYRVARPGTYALVWALPRTSHWTATAVEDAGWTIRDVVVSLNGQGFPKAKSCLKPGSEHWILAYKPGGPMAPLQIDACRIGWDTKSLANDTARRASPRTDITGGSFGKASGRQVAGGYEGVKDSPAGRWPANVVLQHHEDCRCIGTKRVKGTAPMGEPSVGKGRNTSLHGGGVVANTAGIRYADADGKETVEAWECHADCAVAMLDRQSGTSRGDSLGRKPRSNSNEAWRRLEGRNSSEDRYTTTGYMDSGGASRFFPTFKYTAKASRSDRGVGNNHPTVKSFSLMSWLCRLITPPDGTILDPFAGSGSTGKAAISEGFGFIGIESDPAYFAIAESRIEAARAATPLLLATP